MAILFLAAGFLLGACTKTSPNSRLERIKSRAAELQHKKTEIETSLKKVGDQDPGKKTFLTQDLEQVESHLLRLKEQAKALNGGVEVPLGPAEASSGGH